MDVFGSYSHYYNLFYQDKDYSAEVNYALSQIRRYSPVTQSLLELGSGTGAHAEHLARLGYNIHGVDLSESMLQEAESRKRSLPQDAAQLMSFSHGDARSVRLNKPFDAVLSLFHVISYQTSNTDLSAVFASAASHLEPGGIFFFDFWYGPAVLTQRPDVRVKRLKDEGLDIIRIAEPSFRPNENIVDVNYQILIESQRDGVLKKIQETHSMRYLFIPEIEFLLAENGFELLGAYEWMTQEAPGFGSWNACVLSRRL